MNYAYPLKPRGPRGTAARDKTAAAALAACGFLISLTGCAQVRPQQDFARTRDLIAKTTGADNVYDAQHPAITVAELNEILADGLTAKEAVRIALLNNRTIQAGFMAIGVAKADWVQSGLFTNPILSIAARLPEGGGRANLDAAIAQNIAEIWQIPQRKTIAQAELDRTVLQIAHNAAATVAVNSSAQVIA